MPNKHFYVAMGAAHGVLLVIALRAARHWLYRHTRWMRRLYRWDRDWFLYFPVLIAAVSVWGLIPDLLHGLSLLPKDVTRSAAFNIFFFHSLWEELENSSPALDRVLNLSGLAVLLTISLGIMIFYVREIKRIERQEAGSGRQRRENA